MTTPWQDHLATRQKTYIDELTQFLRIPSISSLSQNQADVQAAAEWVASRLKTAGVENIKIFPTGGHPVVYGDWLHADDKPTVMIYGHFDTQPVDPVALWSHPPFEPVIKSGRIYARGASDDKGNMLAPILATEALLKSEGELPLNLKFFFEGQEEIGSPQLPEFVAANKDRFACDLVVSADGGQWDADQPAILTGLRGICALQIDVRGARGDLHSGAYGGAILNPLQALVQLLATMHDGDGRIQVDGFYDAVASLNDVEQAQFDAIPFDEAQYKKEIDIPDLFGEEGYGTYERLWCRPTLEFNGIWGGFTDEGTKTVIPSEAHAKITCRLVPNQSPDNVVTLIEEHIQRHTPRGVTVTVVKQTSKADPYVIPHDHPGNQAAISVHQKLYGKEPFYVRMGGTIPVCAMFRRHLNAYTVNFAFGLDDENIHAPDEFWRLESFTRAQKGYAMLLEELGRLNAEAVLQPENP